MIEKDSIQRKNGVPISSQIAQLIIGEISVGALKVGDPLVPERKMADYLGVSRGTVKAAYSILKKRGIIDSSRGGYYRVIGANEAEPERLFHAGRIIDEMVQSLRALKLSDDEIYKLLNIRLQQNKESSVVVHVAIIECRRDAFYLFENQLAHIPNIELSLFLVDDVLQSAYTAEKVMCCDIIFTTAVHHYELTRQYPQMEEKSIEIVVSWSQKTVFDLAAVKKEDRVGVIYNSPLTIKYIQRALEYFSIEPASFSACNENNFQYLEEFVSQQDVIIAEPPSSFFSNAPLISEFERKGGIMIRFEHVIDKGSLMIIEQSVNNVFAQKKRISQNGCAD